MLNPGHLVTFLAVVRTGNMHAAARACGLSQGAVSQQLSRLEKAVGQKLLERSARGCVATAAGTDLIPYAESLLRLNERARAAVAEQCVTVGASSNIGVYLLQPYLRSYLNHTEGRYPIDVHIHTNPAIAKKLEDGEIDVAAMEWWTPRPGYIAEPWRNEELVAIVPPNHPWKDFDYVPRDLLKRTPLLVGEPGTGTGRLLARYLDAELQIAMRLGSTEAVKQWVKAGLGVSLVLASTVEAERRAGTIVVIPLEGSDAPRKQLYVIWGESLAERSGGRALVDWLFNGNSDASIQP